MEAGIISHQWLLYLDSGSSMSSLQKKGTFA